MQRQAQCASTVQRWRFPSPPFAVLWTALAAYVSSVACLGLPAAFAETKYAHQISSRLNPTGRTVAFPVPLKDGDVNLGEVTIQITADDVVLIEKSAIAEKVAPALGETAVQLLGAIPDTVGFIPIETLAAAGLNIRFDAGLQELQLVLSTEQRPTGDVSLGGRPMQKASSTLTEPEFVAGYLNIIGGLDQNWDTGQAGGDDASNKTSGRLELDSAVRIGGIVVENRAAMEGDVDASICPQDATCVYGHVGGLKRQSSRLVYDLPSDQVRVQIGDTDALAVPLQRSTEVLGLSLEKSARKLNPGENISSNGGGSFTLDRAASVDVLVNGAVVQRLQLRPGNYNLRDLPLSAGANDIELTITSENGERKTLTFSAYSDQSLLASGKSEWAVAAGLPSYLLDNERTYGDNSYLGTGFFRYGLRDGLTGEADVQGDSRVIMAGSGLDIETKFGIVGIHGAGSSGSYGSGGAADLDWSLSNFKGLSDERSENLHLSAEYRSTNFHTPGEALNTASGILYPEFNYWLRLNGSYSMPVTGDITATVSGRYQFGDEDRKISSAYTVSGDRYGADLTLSSAITQSANASLLVGYSNELYLYDQTERDRAAEQNQKADFRVALRFNVRPADNASITSGYDTLGNQAAVSAYQGYTSGIEHWDTSVDVQNRGYEKTASVNAAAGYRGNRAELRLSHYADADGIALGDFDGHIARQRTSVRAGTAIAFAGSKVAIGAPVRGGAFAIVAPHESLAGKEVTVGSADNVRAIADEWGNGLVSDLPAYMPGSLSVDVDELPLGYSLGSAAFDTFAPYKAGYAIEVGSSFSVSVYGTLVMTDGQPVALVTGLAHPEGQPAKQVSVFTNAEGKFGAEGLAPGRWVLDMATEGGATQFIIDVPEGTNGLVKAGTLQPSEGPSR